MEEKILIKNGSVLLPDGLKITDMELSDGVITRIERKISPSDSDVIIEAQGKYVLPGFIDIHTNGIAGFDLTMGVYDPAKDAFESSEDVYLQGLETALTQYARTGVTRAVLTSLASPFADLLRVFRYVSKLRKDPHRQKPAGVLAGLYVEGTFMKEASYRGAHNADYFNEPSKKLFDQMQDAADGMIRIVNVVPEWGESALELIRYLQMQGVICAAGHTGATGEQYAQAINNGTRLATHFPNGPTGSSVKPFEGGGAAETVLRANEVFAEIIADGYHVDRAYVMDTIKRKGFDHVVVITDSMFPTLLDELRKFSMLGVEGRVSSNGEYLQIAERGNALFGSTLTMQKAFSNILNWLTTPIEGVWYKKHEPLSFKDAIQKASVMCTGNPARVLGIYEPDNATSLKQFGDYTGSIQTGKSADVVIIDIENAGHEYDVKIDRVFVKGEPF